jgi:hypothetical protein
MKHVMSAQQSESISYGIFGIITGLLQYKPVALNIPLLSFEWITNSFHAVITAGFCAIAGWGGKKIAEVGYNALVEYFKNRKNKLK